MQSAPLRAVRRAEQAKRPRGVRAARRASDEQRERQQQDDAECKDEQRRVAQPLHEDVRSAPAQVCG
eukprot:CAMPEP_0196708508 /NCGR_PEP_ID=MMETSP1090-20130531/66147_1 /TAXON_ID=37098 /ORGANISM="Isochrysis sp, Strain CCMP1244" /LENGTH=66 /DNA_ID=CAMNT_0042048499 /DNA_START=169 /DNA_END=366 /DNA_ORIENTATION=-